MGREIKGVLINGMSPNVTVLVLLFIVIMAHVHGALHTVGTCLSEIVRSWHIAVEDISTQNLGPDGIVAGSTWGNKFMVREITSVGINGMSVRITILILLAIIMMEHVLGALGAKCALLD